MSQFDPGLDIVEAALKGRVLEPPDREDVEMEEATGTVGDTEAIYWRLWIKGHEERDFVTANVKNAIEGTVRKSRRAYVPSTWTIPPRNLLVRTIRDHLKGGLGRAHEGAQEWPVTRIDCRWKPTSQDEWFEAKEWMEKTVNRSIRAIQQFNPPVLPQASETWFGMAGTIIGLQPELRTGHDTNYNDTMPKLTDIGWQTWKQPGQPELDPFSFVIWEPFGGLGAPVNPNARQWSVKEVMEPTLNWSFHVKSSVATATELDHLKLYIRESFSDWMASLWNRPWISSTQYNDLSDPRQWGRFLDVRIQGAYLRVFADAEQDLRAGDNDDDQDEDSREHTYRISCKWNVDQQMMGLPFLQHAFRPVLSGQEVVTQNGIHEYELLCIQMHRIESVRARADDRPHFYSGWRENLVRDLWPRLSRDQYNQWKCGLIEMAATRNSVNWTADQYNTDEERTRVRVEFFHAMNKEQKLLNWRFWIKGELTDIISLHMRRAFRERIRALLPDALAASADSFVLGKRMHFGDPRAKTRGMTRVDCWWVVNRHVYAQSPDSGLLGNSSSGTLQNQIAEMSRIFEIESVRMAHGDKPTWRSAPKESVNIWPPEHDNQTLYDAWECDLSRVHR